MRMCLKCKINNNKKIKSDREIEIKINKTIITNLGIEDKNDSNSRSIKDECFFF